MTSESKSASPIYTPTVSLLYDYICRVVTNLSLLTFVFHVQSSSLTAIFTETPALTEPTCSDKLLAIYLLPNAQMNMKISNMYVFIAFELKNYW